MKDETKRNIPLRNYLLALVIIIGVILLTLYLFRGLGIFNKNINYQSDLYRTVYEVQYDELNSSIFLEATDNYFIYVSYLDDNEAIKLEEKVKKVIVDNDLQTSFYYLNATDLKKETTFIENLNNKLELEEKITYLPAIIYYRYGEAQRVISSKENKIFNINELKKIIKEYELEN